MKKLAFIPILIFCSCIPSNDSKEKSKAEIVQAEKDFAQHAKEKGAADAFYTFADDSAVIRRGSQVIKGKDAIKEFYEKQPAGELQWSPDFADASGDLGYTYNVINLRIIWVYNFDEIFVWGV